jgi:hypothetical protein
VDGRARTQDDKRNWRESAAPREGARYCLLRRPSIRWLGRRHSHLDDVVAGAVGVSGLSSREDVELATMAIELIGAQKIP